MRDHKIDLREREVIRRIAERHGARNVRVFGSVARGEARPDSDLDLLVEAGPSTTPWFPGGLVVDLEEALGRRVDVVTVGGLVAGLRERILAESVPV
jgi:predicted nucleotidyltransferase